MAYLPAGTKFLPERWLRVLKSWWDGADDYLVLTVRLRDGREFQGVSVYRDLIVGVRGFAEVPFDPESIEAMQQEQGSLKEPSLIAR